jgi:multiple sugar transport system permease protein
VLAHRQLPGLIEPGTPCGTAVPAAVCFISYAQIDWGGLMAAAVVITVPVLVLALVTQRFIVRGLTAGAVKG